MKKRLDFKCWDCEQPYSLLKELEGKPKLLVACPYCGKEGVVELDPFRTGIVNVQRGSKEGSAVPGFSFPEVIPTTQPED